MRSPVGNMTCVGWRDALIDRGWASTAAEAAVLVSDTTTAVTLSEATTAAAQVNAVSQASRRSRPCRVSAGMTELLRVKPRR
jgi:hypothetical protein